MRGIQSLSWALYVLLILTSAAAAQSPSADPTVVAIDSGTIRGIAANGVRSFRGIPYAAPPVGDLRWRAPQPVKAWQGVLSVDRFGPACMQPGSPDDLFKIVR
jgi:para-nitrobenzyl esterase